MNTAWKVFAVSASIWRCGGVSPVSISPDSLVAFYTFPAGDPTKATVGKDAVFGVGVTAIPGADSSDDGAVRRERDARLTVFPVKAPGSPGERINEWTLAIDARYVGESLSSYVCIYQANLDNSDDGDGWFRFNGGYGIGQHTYQYSELQVNEWFRVVIAADFAKHEMRYYFNGRLVNHPTGAACANCDNDERFSLDPAGVYLFVDNDGEDMVAEVTMAAIWSTALSEDQVHTLGIPGLGARDLGRCAATDHIGAWLLRGAVHDKAAPRAVGGPERVSRCGAACCAASLEGELACSSEDPRYLPSGDSCVEAPRSRCTLLYDKNVWSETNKVICTAQASEVGSAFPMEPLLAHVSIPEYVNLGAKNAFWATYQAFLQDAFFDWTLELARLVPSPLLSHNAAKTGVRALVVDAIVGDPDDANLMQSYPMQVVYELASANASHIRTRTTSGSATVEAGRVELRQTDVEGFRNFFGAGRDVPIPTAAISDGIESSCSNMGISLEQAQQGVLMAPLCASQGLREGVYTTTEGKAASCVKFGALLRALDIDKAAILFSIGRFSTHMRDLAQLLPSCPELNHTELEAIELCNLDETEVITPTCRSTESALLSLKQNRFRVILALLTGEIITWTSVFDAMRSTGMHGPQYLWILQGGQLGEATPSVHFVEVAGGNSSGELLDGNFFIADDCLSDVWNRFDLFLGTLGPEDFPEGFVANADMDVVGGSTIAVDYNLRPGLGTLPYQLDGLVTPATALTVDATIAVLLAISALRQQGHEPADIPRALLQKQFESLRFEGACGTFQWRAGVRELSTPMSVFSTTRTEEQQVSGRYQSNYNWKTTRIASVKDGFFQQLQELRFAGGATQPPPDVPTTCEVGEETLDDMRCQPCKKGYWAVPWVVALVARDNKYK